MNTDTGKAMGVEFSFERTSTYGNIPPERYYAMKQQIKHDVTVILTAEGRRRNYNLLGPDIPGVFVE